MKKEIKKKYSLLTEHKNELLCNDKKGDKERKFYKKLFYGSFDFFIFIFISFSFDFWNEWRNRRQRWTNWTRVFQLASAAWSPPSTHSSSSSSQSTESSCSAFSFSCSAQLFAALSSVVFSFPYLPLVIIVHLRFLLLYSQCYSARNCHDENFTFSH